MIECPKCNQRKSLFMTAIFSGINYGRLLLQCASCGAFVETSPHDDIQLGRPLAGDFAGYELVLRKIEE